jgi:hypothetical protein
MINLSNNKNDKKTKILSNLACTIPLNLEEQEKLFFENNCSIDPQFI